MSVTSWFRLADVLPLAEHAVASGGHRLTRAQALAHAALGPALIWDAGDLDDTLSSNGVPGWYGEAGRAHTAVAWTCRHPAIRHRRTAARSGCDCAYLPLQARDGGRSLIERLRQAHDDGMHWVAVTVDGPDAHLVTAEQVRVVDHREDLVPVTATWSPAVVTATATGPGWYPAMIADRYRAAGRDDLIARFDRATVDQMVVDLIAIHADTDPRTDPMPGEYAVLGFDGAALVVGWEHDDGEQCQLVELDRVYPDADGLYAVGCYLWPWRSTSTPTEIGA